MTTGRINQVTILSNLLEQVALAKHKVSNERSYQTPPLQQSGCSACAEKLDSTTVRRLTAKIHRYPIAPTEFLQPTAPNISEEGPNRHQITVVDVVG